MMNNMKKNEMNFDELNQVAGGKVQNGMYYVNPVTGWTPYKIKAGDCLSVLAANRGTTVSAIMFANPLIDNPNVIIAGCYMLLPKK